jgi:hypothetical protein
VLNRRVYFEVGLARVTGRHAWRNPSSTPNTVNKTGSSFGLTPTTTVLMRDYLAELPARHLAEAPLFPGTRLTVPRPTGVRAEQPAPKREGSPPQARALADLSVAEGADQLVLDWSTTTLGICTQLFNTDDHTDAMRGLDPMSAPAVDMANVVRLSG